MAKKRYDLVVVGGGAAGLVASVAGGAFGAKTALVEKEDRLGGECSWTGCVPSKALIAQAEQAHRCGSVPNDVMEKVRDTVQLASKSSKTKELLSKYSVDRYFGGGRFLDSHRLETPSGVIEGRKFILCTGSQAAIPPIPGLEDGYLTNREVWDLTSPPGSMLVVGGGPIGTELAQAFARLGTKVHLFHDMDRLLPKDDVELARELTESLDKEGVSLYLNQRVEAVKKTEKGWEIPIGDRTITGDEMLISLGRGANTEGLELENAGVEYTRERILVNGHLRTSTRHIWAAGDCTANMQFSHAAEVEAKTAVRNALFPLNSRPDYQGQPWTTFTSPELAHLGLTEEECQTKNIRYRTYYQPFSGDDRSITDGTIAGKVKIIATPLGKLLGVHILGHRAGELINEFVLARRKRMRVYDIGLTVHVYPTLGLAGQRATDQWFAEWSEQPWVRFLMGLVRR